MISKLSIICLFVMCSEISSDKFCQEFRQNKDRIQYPFRRDFEATDIEMTKHFIVIRGKCWAIDFKHKPSAEPTLTLEHQSKDCAVFNGDYTFGLCLNTKKFVEKYLCDAYLFNMDSAKGVIAQIPDDKHIDYKDLSEYKVTSDLTISGHESAKSFVSVFQSDRNKTKGMLIFVRVTDQKLVTKLFAFNLKEKAIELKEEDNSKVTKDFPVLNGSTIGINELLAVISQYNQKEGANGWGFILLEKKDAKIFWCWTPAPQFDCKTEVLVDCSSEPPYTDLPEKEGDDGTGWVIIMCIVFLAVSVFVAILVIAIGVFLIKNPDYVEPASAQVSASAVGDAGALSKRSQDVTSTAPNASAVGSKAGAATPSTSKASATPSGQSAKAVSPKKA